MRTFIERWRPGTGAEHRLASWFERLKRFDRQGWRLTIIEELATGDFVALGYLPADAEPAPDRTGQFELEPEP